MKLDYLVPLLLVFPLLEAEAVPLEPITQVVEAERLEPITQVVMLAHQELPIQVVYLAHLADLFDFGGDDHRESNSFSGWTRTSADKQ